MVESDPALNSQNGEQVLRSIQEWMIQQAHAAKTVNQAADIDNHASRKGSREPSIEASGSASPERPIDPSQQAKIPPVANNRPFVESSARQNARLTRATRKFHRSRATGHLSKAVPRQNARLTRASTRKFHRSRATGHLSKAVPRQNARLTRASTRKFHRSRATGHLSKAVPRQNARLTRASTRKFHRSRATGHLSKAVPRQNAGFTEPARENSTGREQQAICRKQCLARTPD